MSATPPLVTAPVATERVSQSPWPYCYQALRAVSRTFSRPIEALGKMRQSVTVGYLLCRIVDEVEDDVSCSETQREQRYRAFLEFVAKPSEQRALKFSNLFSEISATSPQNGVVQ